MTGEWVLATAKWEIVQLALSIMSLTLTLRKHAALRQGETVCGGADEWEPPIQVRNILIRITTGYEVSLGAAFKSGL